SFSANASPEWRQQRASVIAVRELMLSIRQREPHATFCGIKWAAPHVLEYALPGAQWLRYCEGHIPEIASSPSSPTYLLLLMPAYNVRVALGPERNYAACSGKVLHKDETLAVLRCSAGQQVSSVAETP